MSMYCWLRRRRSSLGRLRTRGPTSTLPRTVRHANSMYDWNTNPLVVAGALDFPAIHEHPAHGGLFKPGDHAEQGGLAALPGAEDDHKLVAPHVDGDVPEHMDLRIPLLNEGLADAFTLDFGFSHDISFRGGCGVT